MNKHALIFGTAYALLVVAIKLAVLLGGYSLTRFGFYYAHITSVFLIIPFYIFAVLRQRRLNGGTIGGREGLRVALSVFAVGALLTSVYNYVEFEQSGKQLAIDYYNSQQFLDFLKSQSKIKAADYSKIIAEQIQNADVSAFKATTGRLFSLMLIGLSGAFIVAATLKRKAV